MSSVIQSGTQIEGKYRLEHELGSGAMGTVWLGRQIMIDRPVAIKLVHKDSDEELEKRFQVEAQALGRLNHPNCVTLHDFGYSDELEAFYLVMEHLEGASLTEWRTPPIPFHDVIELSRQICTALACAHHRGVLHRDLKPENVLICETFGGEAVVKVLDFGLARLMETESRLTAEGEVFGTPPYMSPEQIQAKEVGPPTDLYALGIIIYELIEDRLPFWGESAVAVLEAHLDEPPPYITRPGTPHELEELVYRLLEKDPDDRPASAKGVAQALQAIDLSNLDERDTTSFVVTTLDELDTLEDDGNDSSTRETVPDPELPGSFEAEDRTTQQIIEGPIAPARDERPTAPFGFTAPQRGAVPPEARSSPVPEPSEAHCRERMPSDIVDTEPSAPPVIAASEDPLIDETTDKFGDRNRRAVIEAAARNRAHVRQDTTAGMDRADLLDEPTRKRNYLSVVALLAFVAVLALAVALLLRLA